MGKVHSGGGGLSLCQRQDPQLREYLFYLECSHLAACSDQLPNKGLPSQLGRVSAPDKFLREFAPALILSWLSHLLLGFALLGYDGAPTHQIFLQFSDCYTVGCHCWAPYIPFFHDLI